MLESRLENYPCIVNTCLYRRSSLSQLFRRDRVRENVAIIYFYRWNELFDSIINIINVPVLRL